MLSTRSSGVTSSQGSQELHLDLWNFVHLEFAVLAAKVPYQGFVVDICWSLALLSGSLSFPGS